MQQAAFLQVKNNHILFPQKYIEDMLKNYPGGTHIVMKGSHEEIDHIDLGYRYISKWTQHFIMAANAWTTKMGALYKTKLTDTFGNIHIQKLKQRIFNFGLIRGNFCLINGERGSFISGKR